MESGSGEGLRKPEWRADMLSEADVSKPSYSKDYYSFNGVTKVQLLFTSVCITYIFFMY